MDVDSSDSLPARIAAALAEQIIRGDLRPGARVRQDAIADEFNASHVPVREAFRRLEARGLLVSRERKGVYVPVLDQASIIEITRMRTALEVLALRYAIPNLTQDDITCAENAMHKGNTARDISTWEAANREFHASIYRPCQMPRLLSHIDALHEARLRYMYATSTLIEWDVKSENEHLEILEAIKAKDGRSARALMEKHINDAGSILVAAVSSLHTQTDD
ncbi:GntR family transcriptional regulator [Paraburkholderia strydomiana]|uniref:GntR family transcriptional regulator n=1 Tax=Paraburkholderia strydomiana TaxID=1245417 RepID=UPI00285FBBE7|nr:GntR family transcriptional regulator [Paraburkholderia strydomiana]MDR7009386.1 DNA-binding GntR family transcriptional regulator [Paraburkholderia strydomiana]